MKVKYFIFFSDTDISDMLNPFCLVWWCKIKLQDIFSPSKAKSERGRSIKLQRDYWENTVELQGPNASRLKTVPC